MTASNPDSNARAKGPPPLRPFGLVLCHDGQFLHEGQPIANRRLREHLERSVEYLVEEQKYIVRLGHFRGQIDVQEAGFFVRAIDLETGRISLSDGTTEPFVLEDLSESLVRCHRAVRWRRGRR